MAGNEIKGEMIRGHVDTFILLSLCNGDKDSNEIKVAIENRSDNKFTVKQGTFYSAMQRLIKQNYIKEYRSSAADGIRRKYYSLTDKGRKSLEKNREEWAKSKELIDNLIDTPEQPEKPEKQLPEVKDEFEEFKKLAEQNASDYTFFAPDNSDDSYLGRLGAEVLNDLNNELDSLKSEEENKANEEEILEEQPVQSSVYDEILPPDDSEIVTDASDEVFSTEDVSAENVEEDVLQSGDYEDNLSENDIVYDFEIPEEILEEKPEIVENNVSENFEKSSENVEEIQPVIETANGANNLDSEEIETKKPAAEQDKKSDDDGKDDSLYVEEGSPTNRREYKTILGKLFPKNEVTETKTENVTSNENRQIDFDEYTESKQNGKIYDDYNEIDDDEEFLEEEPPKNNRETAPKREKPQSDAYADENLAATKQNDYDFSDLYKMAKAEGFKVRTSLSTNKFNGNGIFINKLNLHASLLFYGILLIEMLVLNFALSGVLGWPFGAKALIAGIPALLPLVMFFIYLVSPKRKIREVSQFKDVITVFLIVTFQLVIVDLCVALFFEVDFNNIKEVLSFIIVPFILLINIPLFAIVKYSLLESGRYFDETASR